MLSYPNYGGACKRHQVTRTGPGPPRNGPVPRWLLCPLPQVPNVRILAEIFESHGADLRILASVGTVQLRPSPRMANCQRPALLV